MKNFFTFLLILLSFVVSHAGQASEKPIMLEFTLLAQHDETVVEITSNKSVYSDDRIHMVIKPLQACYVYIINQDTKGKIHGLFPLRVENITALEKGKLYSVTENDQNFVLDDVVGAEYIYIAASLEPLNDIEKLMLQVKNKVIMKDIISCSRKSLGTAKAVKGSQAALPLGNHDVYKSSFIKLIGTNSFLYTIEFDHLDRDDQKIEVTTRGLKKRTKKKPTDMTGSAGQKTVIAAP